MRDDPYLRYRAPVLLVVIVGALLAGLVLLGRFLVGGAGSEVPGDAAAADGIPPLAEVLPIDAAGYEAAATVALRHAESYGTFTPGLSDEEYLERIRDAAPLADTPEGVPLTPARPAYRELSALRHATDGAARVTGIEFLGERSLDLVVEIEAVATDGTVIDLGEHTLLLAVEGDGWVVAGTGWEAEEEPIGD